MASKYARGKKAVGICQRSGIKLPRARMVEDGYSPGLMVHPEWKEERHPQERLPKINDPQTIYKPAPDDIGDPPGLSLNVVGLTAQLTWTQAAPINARIDSYDVYRSTNGVDYTLIVSLPITYDVFMAITAQTLAYNDAMPPGSTVTYYVVAKVDPTGPDTLASNIVQAVTSPNNVIRPNTGALTIVAAIPPVVTNTSASVRVPGTGSLVLTGNQADPGVAAFMLVAGRLSANTQAIMTSSDGVNWTLQSTSFSPNVQGICFSPELNRLVTVGNNSAMSSDDGVTWTQRTPAAALSWADVCWSPEQGLFVAVSNGNGISTPDTNSVMTSPDGITWTRRTTPSPDRVWRAVRWLSSAGLFVAGGQETSLGARNGIMTSPDGITWTTRTSALNASAVQGYQTYRMTTGNGFFFCSSRSDTGMQRSADGITWSFLTDAVAASSGRSNIAYGEGKVVMIVNSPPRTAKYIYSTDDGVSWTATPVSNQGDEGAAYSPELGLFVSTGPASVALHKAMYSLDGVTWAEGNTPSGADTNGDWFNVCSAAFNT